MEAHWNQALIRVSEIESKISALDPAALEPSPVMGKDIAAFDLRTV
ncbi:hypothetical protein X740_16340 [Mesorhizobium sp. LNHC221B00]|nr:hypothetical protein X740_16340 [Mesorhizobium sp. LNHC221B00]